MHAWRIGNNLWSKNVPALFSRMACTNTHTHMVVVATIASVNLEINLIVMDFSNIQMISSIAQSVETLVGRALCQHVNFVVVVNRKKRIERKENRNRNSDCYENGQIIGRDNKRTDTKKLFRISLPICALVVCHGVIEQNDQWTNPNGRSTDEPSHIQFWHDGHPLLRTTNWLMVIASGIESKKGELARHWATNSSLMNNGTILTQQINAGSIHWYCDCITNKHSIRRRKVEYSHSEIDWLLFDCLNRGFLIENKSAFFLFWRIVTDFQANPPAESQNITRFGSLGPSFSQIVTLDECWIRFEIHFSLSIIESQWIFFFRFVLFFPFFSFPSIL